MAYAQGRILASHQPFVHILLSNSMVASHGHWTKQTLYQILSTIITLAATLAHEMSHAYICLITRHRFEYEPFVNDDPCAEMGYALETFLFGGSTNRDSRGGVDMATWPNLGYRKVYGAREKGKVCRAFLMPERIRDRAYDVGPEECKRLLSAANWAMASETGRPGVRRSERRFEVMLDIFTEGKVEPAELKSMAKPLQGYGDELLNLNEDGEEISGFEYVDKDQHEDQDDVDDDDDDESEWDCENEVDEEDEGDEGDEETRGMKKMTTRPKRMLTAITSSRNRSAHYTTIPSWQQPPKHEHSISASTDSKKNAPDALS